ncbi:DUF3800 domain-containing protein [Martelella soudanensis]|uniref:DUF3800 domain-containing protein n=1 Tax=unclassified Martelella TaxID=2629616 RepID=UPI0015DE98DB|nr:MULTISPECIES: DUF3800 domain-containing protein [unclassified Martelella]
MTHSYVAYIDESGDEGIGNFREPGKRGGASKWLILSAIVYRFQNDLEAVRWRDEIVANMPKKKTRTLHFADMNHGQKLLTVKSLSALPVRCISVIDYKPLVPDSVFEEKNQHYFYLTRYLLERLSWLCRDLRPTVPEGDGRVKITFSRRGGMQYDDFREYLRHLKRDTQNDIRIHWPVIDIDSIDAKDHSKLAGLQLVDSVASAVANGLEIDIYGNCEPRYAETLKPITYCRKHNYFSYGMKFIKPLQELKPHLNEEQRRTIDLFK